MPKLTKGDRQNLMNAKDIAASSGNRRLMFALVFMESGFERILAELQTLPKTLDFDNWVWFSTNVMAHIERLIEDEIDATYPGLAWEYDAEKGHIVHVA
jgi:hypothetical protein